jgi:hypothetical protein
MDAAILFVLSIFILFLGIFILGFIRTRKNWESWPTVDQYMANYNPSKGKGISCYKCGSHHIWESGFGNSNSDMRLHYCKQCKTNLYRTERS